MLTRNNRGALPHAPALAPVEGWPPASDANDTASSVYRYAAAVLGAGPSRLGARSSAVVALPGQSPGKDYRPARP